MQALSIGEHDLKNQYTKYEHCSFYALVMNWTSRLGAS